MHADVSLLKYNSVVMTCLFILGPKHLSYHTLEASGINISVVLRSGCQMMPVSMQVACIYMHSLGQVYVLVAVTFFVIGPWARILHCVAALKLAAIERKAQVAVYVAWGKAAK